jgi:hypothetical protein
MARNESDPIQQMSLVTQAVQCITTAHQLEPENAEISIQFQDLSQALGDLNNEQQVKNINAKETTKELISTITSTSDAADASSSSRSSEQQEQTLQKVLSSLLDPSSEIEIVASFALVDQFKQILLTSQSTQQQETQQTGCKIELNEHMYQTLLHALDEKPTQVYFRTSEALSATLSLVANSFTHLSHTAPTLSHTQSEILTLSQLVKLLAKALHDERPSKAILQDSYASLITHSMDLLSWIHLPAELSEALATFLNTLLSPQSQKMRKMVLKQKDFMICICSAICCHLNNVSITSSGQNALRTFCLLLKELVFSEDGKQSLLSQTSPGVLVPLFGSILNKYCEDKKRKRVTTPWREMADVAIETLLGCSQSESLRPAFLDPLDQEAKEQATTPAEKITTVHIILRLCQQDEWIQSNGLAILMNLTLRDDDALRAIRPLLYKNHAFDLCLQLIQEIRLEEVEEKAEEAETDSRRLRAIGVLSRLATLPEVQKELQGTDCFRSLLTLFRRNSQYLFQINQQQPPPPPPSATAMSSILREECYQLIRLFASMTQLSEHCLSLAQDFSYLKTLLGYLPMPRMELNEITPQSVILSPQETFLWNTKTSYLLVGNIARCLIPFADDGRHSREIFENKENYGVEKLVCMMATCSGGAGDTSVRVRKNIAIILAKGCCHSRDIKKKVETYRGLQMIVELQSQLV